MSTAWRQWLWLWSINMMTWLSFTRLKELESRTGTRGSEGEEVKQERNCLSPVLFYSYSTGTDIKTIVKHMIWHSYNCLQGDYCQDAAASHDWRVKSTSQCELSNLSTWTPKWNMRGNSTQQRCTHIPLVQPVKFAATLTATSAEKAGFPIKWRHGERKKLRVWHSPTKYLTTAK